MVTDLNRFEIPTLKSHRKHGFSQSEILPKELADVSSGLGALRAGVRSGRIRVAGQWPSSGVSPPSRWEPDLSGFVAVAASLDSRHQQTRSCPARCCCCSYRNTGRKAQKRQARPACSLKGGRGAGTGRSCFLHVGLSGEKRDGLPGWKEMKSSSQYRWPEKFDR